MFIVASNGRKNLGHDKIDPRNISVHISVTAKDVDGRRPIGVLHTFGLIYPASDKPTLRHYASTRSHYTSTQERETREVDDISTFLEKLRKNKTACVWFRFFFMIE